MGDGNRAFRCYGISNKSAARSLKQQRSRQRGIPTAGAAKLQSGSRTSPALRWVRRIHDRTGPESSTGRPLSLPQRTAVAERNLRDTWPHLRAANTPAGGRRHRARRQPAFDPAGRRPRSASPHAGGERHEGNPTPWSPSCAARSEPSRQPWHTLPASANDGLRLRTGRTPVCDDGHEAL